MKLGILVNTDRHLRDIVGLTTAAVAGGHEVVLFAMDAGTRLLGDPSYTELCRLPGVALGGIDLLPHLRQRVEYHRFLRISRLV